MSAPQAWNGRIGGSPMIAHSVMAAASVTRSQRAEASDDADGVEGCATSSPGDVEAESGVRRPVARRIAGARLQPVRAVTPVSSVADPATATAPTGSTAPEPGEVSDTAGLVESPPSRSKRSPVFDDQLPAASPARPCSQYEPPATPAVNENAKPVDGAPGDATEASSHVNGTPGRPVPPLAGEAVLHSHLRGGDPGVVGGRPGDCDRSERKHLSRRTGSRVRRPVPGHPGAVAAGQSRW